MLKNILIGIVTAVLVVAVGTAAYNVIGAQAAGTGTAAQGSFGQGNGQGGNRQGGNGQANGSGVPQAQAQSMLASAETISGTVSDYSYGTLTIQTPDGKSVGVGIGNSSYATSIGFAPQPGDVLSVYGFNGDEGLFSAITIRMSDGTVFTFRDPATGRPSWAGGNGKGGNGQGGTH